MQGYCYGPVKNLLLQASIEAFPKIFNFTVYALSTNGLAHFLVTSNLAAYALNTKYR